MIDTLSLQTQSSASNARIGSTCFLLPVREHVVLDEYLVYCQRLNLLDQMIIKDFIRQLELIGLLHEDEQRSDADRVSPHLHQLVGLADLVS